MSRVRIIRSTPTRPPDAGKQTQFAGPLHAFQDRSSGVKRVLNVGAGSPNSKSLHPVFQSDEWQEIRLDIDARVQPDVVGSIIDLAYRIPTSSVDAIWCSHILEHLYESEVEQALADFLRILRPGGFILAACPDLEEVARLIQEKGLDAEAYRSPAGPIRALDMLYGFGAAIREKNYFMCHRTGFTADTLGRAIRRAGFAEVRTSKGPGFNLWALALTGSSDRAIITEMFRRTNQAFLVDQMTDIVG